MGLIFRQISSFFPVPPGIVDQETTLEVSIFINEDVTLFCEVGEGTPPPRITWYKDGRRIESNGQDIRVKRHGERLHINQAQVTHSGRYTCLAENVAGRAEKFYGLLVMGELFNMKNAISKGIVYQMRKSITTF